MIPQAGLRTPLHRPDWTTSRLKFLLERHSRPIREEDDVVTAFRDGIVTLRSNRREDGFTFAEKEIGYQGVEPGDLVIHAMDGFAGAIGVSDSRGKCSPVYSIVTPRPHAQVNMRFWAYYLRNLSTTGFIESLAKGIRERSTDFRWKDAGNLLVNFPDLTTQSAIADFLDREIARIDQLIEKSQRMVELLGAKRHSEVQIAVSLGMDRQRAMKPSKIYDGASIPQVWEERRLSTVCRFFQGKAHEPFFADEGDYVAVTARFVSTNGRQAKRCSRNLSPAKRGDILMVMSDLPNGRALARSFLTNQDGVYAVNQRVCALTPQFGDARFYSYQLDRNAQLLRYNDGLNQTHLKNRYFLQMMLRVPPVEEQEKIADYLDLRTERIERIVQKSQLSVDRLREFRTAIITAAVTGQIDIYAWDKRGDTNRRLDQIEAEVRRPSPEAAE